MSSPSSMRLAKAFWPRPGRHTDFGSEQPCEKEPSGEFSWHKQPVRSEQMNKEILMHNKPVALVTGANQGIGLQIAKDLVAHGFTVLVGSRNLERGEDAAKEVGPDARAIQLDVTDQASIAAAAHSIRKELGRLDVLVNNAAISHKRPLSGASVEEYAKSTRP